MDLTQIFFYSGSVVASTLALLMGYTVFSDKFRFWPAGESKLKLSVYWILASVNIFALLALPFLNLGAIDIRVVAGLIIALAGALLTLAGIMQLGILNTSGKGKHFVIDGVYSYSRNPQVVGNLISLVGITAAVPTLQIRILSVLTAVWLLAMIYAEEEFLEGYFGKEYRDYMDDVPRFL